MELEFTSAFQVDKELKSLKMKLLSKKQRNLFWLGLALTRVIEDTAVDSLLTCVLQFYERYFNYIVIGRDSFDIKTVFEWKNSCSLLKQIFI
jgi:hypothetical protein